MHEESRRAQVPRPPQGGLRPAAGETGSRVEGAQALGRPADGWAVRRWAVVDRPLLHPRTRPLAATWRPGQLEPANRLRVHHRWDLHGHALGIAPRAGWAGQPLYTGIHWITTRM